MWLKFYTLRMAVAAVAIWGIAGCSAPVTEKKIAGLTATSSHASNYTIGPNDLVRMDVFQEPDMQTEQRVAQDGTINISLAGRVNIGGLSLEGASKRIAEKLREGYLVNPQVTVNIVEYAPRRFSVLGQVNSPGSFVIPGEEVVTLPTAIAMAGGNTRIGNLRHVLITRERDGQIYNITVNVQTPAGRQFIITKDDLIMVPESLF